MKFKYAAWFWFGITTALTAGDAISYRSRNSVRFPEPLFAIPVWMFCAAIPTLAFYVGGRISIGMFPNRKLRTQFWILLLSGAAYVFIAAAFASAPQPYGKIISMAVAYCAPFLIWLLLSHKIQNEN